MIDDVQKKVDPGLDLSQSGTLTCMALHSSTYLPVVRTAPYPAHSWEKATGPLGSLVDSVSCVAFGRDRR